MATFYWPFSVRDSTRGGAAVPALAGGATFVQIMSVGASPQPLTPAASFATVIEVGHGQYLVAYDAETHGDALAQVDMGGTLPEPGDRYVDVVLTRESPVLLKALPDALPGAAAGLPLVVGTSGGVTVGAYAAGLDPATALANAGVTEVRMQFLEASQGFWTRNGNTITMTTIDGAAIWQVVYDNVDNPTRVISITRLS